MCLIEGTMLSEGRGTTRPFEIFGVRISMAKRWQLLERASATGFFFRPLSFEPTFQKHARTICGGCPDTWTTYPLRSWKTTIAILKTVHDLYPKQFAWKQPPYE
jgi:uncharacterized protein YbbC (DUF1343 family)